MLQGGKMEKEKDATPTIYTNFLTANISTDGLILECRIVPESHRQAIPLDQFEKYKNRPATDVPPAHQIRIPTWEEVYETPPNAKFIISFTAAIALMKFLQNTLPAMIENRKKETL